MEQLVLQICVAHPQVAGWLMLLGVLRILTKPIMSWVHAYVEQTPSKLDDSMWHWLAWVVDWLTSIKIGPQYEALTKSKQQTKETE